MDCKKADEALMLYADKKIKPAMASALAKHILTCESCREVFLLFDETLEALDSFTEKAPAGFTESVMNNVRKLPAYTPVSGMADISIRVFWGLCAVLMGVGMLGMNNPHLFNDYPFLVTFISFFGMAGNALEILVNQFLSTGSDIGATATAAHPFLAVSALFFVAVVGSLLAVLLRGEKSKV